MPFFENDTTGSLQIDWLQGNWELLVEAQAGVPGRLVLEPYGDGADCYGTSSRVLYPDRCPTHRIVCRPREGKDIVDLLNRRALDPTKGDVVFDRFVCMRDDWYYESPPFDKILGTHCGTCVAIGYDDIRFELQSIPCEV